MKIQIPEKYVRLWHSHTSVKIKIDSLGKFATTAQILFNNLVCLGGEGKVCQGMDMLCLNQINLHARDCFLFHKSEYI